jgi:multiple sugar transport system ATP-binding protein
MATVTFDQVTKKYGEVTAVDDLSLEITDGEFMVFVGPSGCGKTTSLRMIAGLEDISSGLLRIGERIVNDVAPKDRDIAMVFQSYALYPHMTVRDNLAFGLKLRKVPKPEIEKRVADAAGILDLGKYLDRKPKELSGGQRQRVALGRAIVREPAVFLMDEPLSNLDAKLRVQTRAEILRLHQRLKTTMVYVTHDQTEAMTMGTRIAVMNEGRLQQVGPPQELYDVPVNRFVAGFIGSPSMNFVDMTTVATSDGRLTLEAAGISLQVPERLRASLGEGSGRTIIAGFRPEHFAISSEAEPGASFAAKADVVEYLGNEELIHLDVAGRDIVALLSSEHRIRSGDAMSLTVPLPKVHLFDPESTLSLTAAVAAAVAS